MFSNSSSRLCYAVLIAVVSGAQIPSPFQITVDVDLVELQVSVRDHQGRLATDLDKPDFEVYEDGVRQTIRLFRNDDVPVTVGVVVDHSGSMRRKLADVIAAARTFIESSRTDDQMFVVNFNERVSPSQAVLIPFTNRPDDLVRAISSMPTSGQTALYDAIAVARERLQSGKWEKKALIVISDGGDNASSHSLAEILEAAERSSAMVYTVGIFDQEDADRNPSVLRRLAFKTGGEALFPERLEDVVAACARIAHDLRHQYTLGYVSENKAKPGAFRSIRVTAHTSGRGKLSVRTRSGYIAAEPHK